LFFLSAELISASFSSPSVLTGNLMEQSKNANNGNNNLRKTGDLKFPNSGKNKPPELVIYILPSLSAGNPAFPLCPEPVL